MNGNSNTDKKLRQLENQSLPDLSKQESHWQQLRAAMQGAETTAPKKPIGKTGWWLLAACVAGVLFVAGYKIMNPAKKDDPFTFTIPQTIITDPAKKDSAEQVVTVKGQDMITSPKHKDSFTPKLTAVQPVKKDKELVTLPEPVIAIQEPKATLADFFKQLEKPEQQFVINPKRDTLIKGHDGSTLLIPANTFNTALAVTIVLREYYSYQDIIANRLNTSSDENQLITGGMLHLTALSDGKEVAMNPEKSIRWFIPDTSSAMQQMSLFTGNTNGKRADEIGNISLGFVADSIYLRDTISSVVRPGTLNWVSNKRPFTRTWLVTMVKVLDLKNDPYSFNSDKKRKTGKFRLSDSSHITKEQLRKEMRTRYGYIKVKIRSSNVSRRRFKGAGTAPNIWSPFNDLGDSTWIPLVLANEFKLVATDTITYTVTDIGLSTGLPAKKQFADINMDELANRFSVDIRTLGWINCDRFYNDKRARLTYKVVLGDTASNYHTVLVFDKFKSMLNGRAAGNTVVFENIPRGEPARIICVGVKDGKTVTAMEPLPENNAAAIHLRLEAITPTEFKEQVARLDK